MQKLYQNAGILTVKNLSVRRGNLTLISGLDISLAPGDTIWIKGGNGIGKTSLLQCCAGLLRPHAGQILWNDNDIEKYATGFCIYQGHIDAHKPELSATENLEFWQSVYKSKHDTNMILERVGLRQQRKLRTKNLSAGQSRRLALARLLISNAPLWILDEPSAAMDVKGRDLIENLLQEHIAKNGSVLLASHGAPTRIGNNTRLLTLEKDINAGDRDASV